MTMSTNTTCWNMSMPTDTMTDTTSTCMNPCLQGYTATHTGMPLSDISTPMCRICTICIGTDITGDASMSTGQSRVLHRSP